jgi:hypothetical protein
MVSINITGIDEVMQHIDKITSDGMNEMLLEIANTLKGDVRHRVHQEGKASDGSQIGTYTPDYMKVRTGNYENRKKITRGKNKGDFAKNNSGSFTKGKNKGNPRPKYNRDNDTDVVLSLTRQMENDMNATEPIKIEGGYGIGYTNEFNYEKAIWNEKRYGKPIWKLTEQEMKTVEDIVSKHVERLKR